MLLFALHIGIQQRHISLAAAPEDVILAAQLDRGVDSVLDLQHGAGRRIEVGIGRRTVHVAGMPENIGRAPKQLDSGFGLLPLGIGDDLLEIRLIFPGSRGFVHQIDIVEAVILDTYFLHELETGVHLGFGPLEGIRRLVPRKRFRAAAELVAAFGTERMPPCHRELEPVLHLLALHDPLGIVVAECHRIPRLLALELDFSYRRKITLCYHVSQDLN